MSESIPNRSTSAGAFDDVRKFVADKLRDKSLYRACLYLLPSVIGYSLVLGLMLLVPWQLMPVIALLMGVMGNLLFVIAHDAAHNSFTPWSWLNGLIARVCFLPAWHSYTGWVHAHNHIHHGWTNLVTRDYVWAPVSKDQYDQLSPARQWLHRFYRTGLGFMAYYLWEINFKRIFLLQPEVRRARVRRMWINDNCLLILGILLQAWGLVQLSRFTVSGCSPWWLILNAQIIPVLLTNYLIGFTTYLQHTHPLIPWFDNQEEWTYYIGQVRGTVHTHFPYQINRLFHNVMDHTAHHADPRVPLYNLPEVQTSIEQAYPGEVVQHRFTFRSYRRTLETCQLYDFRNHCWTDYSGKPTSSRTFSVKAQG